MLMATCDVSILSCAVDEDQLMSITIHILYHITHSILLNPSFPFFSVGSYINQAYYCSSTTDTVFIFDSFDFC